MTSRQKLTKLISEVDAKAAQCRRDGDIKTARKYESESLLLTKELVAIDTESLKKLLAR